MKNISTYQNKYKDRLPEDTVQTIKNFFTRKGFSVSVTDLNQSEIGTWYCRVSIYLHKNLVLGANGKGTTKEYALASGFAELYERFSNRFNYVMSPLFFRDYTRHQKKEKGYYFAPDERELDFNETVNTSAFVRDYLDYYCGNEDNIKSLLNIYTLGTNHFIGVPFTNVFNKDDIKYYDPRILYHATTSNGMAAGNTTEEALVQGISELFERWGLYQFFLYPQEKYYEIDLNVFQDDNISKIYSKIQSLNCDIKVYDLSYNFNIPVIVSVLNYKNKCRFYTNFASAPVVNIAIERTLTEMYQGIQTYKYIEDMQNPYRTITGDEAIMEDGNSITNSTHFPEEVFTKAIKTNYNSNMFLDCNEHDNYYMLYTYYKNICEQLGINLYYRDNSLTKDMSAIIVFIDKIHTFHVEPYPLRQTSNLVKKEWINRLYKYCQICKFIFDNIESHTLTMNNFLQYLDSIQWDIRPLSDVTNYYHGILMLDEWKGHFHPVRNNIGLLDHFAFLHRGMDTLNLAAFSIAEQTIINRFLTLRNYIGCELYSIEEIKQIYKLWGYDLTDTDIKNYNNIDYIFWKSCIEPEQEIYDSGDYDILLNSFIKED